MFLASPVGGEESEWGVNTDVTAVKKRDTEVNNPDICTAWIVTVQPLLTQPGFSNISLIAHWMTILHNIVSIEGSIEGNSD